MIHEHDDGLISTLYVDVILSNMLCLSVFILFVALKNYINKI